MAVEDLQGKPLPFVSIEQNQLREQVELYYLWITLLAYSGNSLTKIISPLLAKKFGVQNQAGFYEKGKKGDDCAVYVFGKVLDEPWGGRHFLRGSLILPLYHGTQDFLQRRGYVPVEKPESGDLVVYGRGEETQPLVVAKHFGVFRSDEWITSKFGAGPVFRHRVQAIPKVFGNMAVFFHKTKQG